MDPTTWIATVTSLAGLVKAWLDARKSGVDLQAAREKIANESRKLTSPSGESGPQADLVIDPTLLKQLVADIQGAKTRFASVFTDPRYTPADIDREEQLAKLAVCTHLRRIREFNRGALPTEELNALDLSFGCG